MTWIALEGTDGAGKSSIIRESAAHLRDYRPILREVACTSLPDSHAAHRLQALHNMVFNYPAEEQVWLYPQRYWLHTLCSFFSLYHSEVIAGVDGSLITDGWALKHWARFGLYEDASLVRAADEAFGSLPWPDRIFLLPRNSHQGTERTFKPSERGAFEHNSAGFDAYQQRTFRKMSEIASRLAGRVEFILLSSATMDAVIDALA